MEMQTSAMCALDALSADFEALLQDESMSDVSFKYFATLFASGFRETTAHDDGVFVISKPNAEPGAFSAFLRFLYSGCMERGVLDDYTRLAEVVTLSDEMMVDSLKSLCESHMLSSLCPTNALVFWEIACAHGLARCESEAGKHIDHAAEQLLSSQWILSASEDTMRNILSRDGLHTSERNVFEAVVRWGSRQQSEKPLRERIRGLIESVVRFPVMSPDDLHSVVEPLNLVEPALLLEAYRFHSLKGAAIVAERQWAFMPRSGLLRIGPLRKFGPCAVLEQDGVTVRHSGRQLNWGGCVLAEPALLVGRTYWEVLIRSGSAGGHVRLGVATTAFKVDDPMEYVGRNTTSLGLYSNGNSVTCQGLQSQVLNMHKGWGNGDRIGLLLEFMEQFALLSCFCNRDYLGVVQLPKERYYPAFCCHCHMDAIQVDFDAEPPTHT